MMIVFQHGWCWPGRSWSTITSWRCGRRWPAAP